MKNNMSFEEVNNHVEQNELPVLKTTAPKGTASKVSIDNLKAIWVIARPILVLVAGISLLPVKWRNTIQKLIDVVDAVSIISL